MSREELPPEDRKLSAVKSWFSRSVSFGGIHGSTTALAAAAASKGLSEGNGHNGEDQDSWGGFQTSLKQLSMRRSKASNENDRDTALGSPSMTPRNVTPLVPLTPLKWKSNPPEQEEEEKTVAVERSRLGLRVTNAPSHSDEHEDERKEEQDARVRTNPFDGFYPNAQMTAAEEDEDDDDDEDESSESASSQDMKSSPGEDVMTMTIDFLRARLLSERSASRAAKQRIQELGTKVLELELKLEQVVEDKKKAEKSAEEALLKLLTGNFAQVSDCTARAAQGLHITSGSGSGGEEIKEALLQQRPESSVGDYSRTDSMGSKDSNDSRRKLQNRNEDRNDANGRATDLWVTPKNMFVTEGETPKKQDKRAAIENRLRKMWSQISADMSVLTETGSQEALLQEQLISWMDQVPAVLQDRAPQKPVEEIQFNDGGPIPEEMRFSLSPPGGVQEKAQVQADAKRAEEEYEAHKSVQREWEKNYYESKKRLEESKGMDAPAPAMSTTSSVHRSRSSIDFRHPHMAKSDDRKGSYSDSDAWGHGRNSAMDGQYHNGNPDHRQKLPYPAAGEYPQRQAERPAVLPRAHDPESREWREQQQLQQDYPETYSRRQVGHPPHHSSERDARNRPSAPATSNRSPEGAFQNPQHDSGGAHPMWDVRDARDARQTHRGSDYRQRDRGSDSSSRNYLPSERAYRHGRRRSHSADSNIWPSEEDNRVMNPAPHHQRLSGEIHPSRSGIYPGIRSSHNFDNRDLRRSDAENPFGMTGYREENYLDTKTMPPPANQAGPANGSEPKLYLGYGPSFDAPRDHAPPPPPPQQPQQDRVSNKSVSDVLLALRKAKANIQKSTSSDRVTGFTDQPRTSSEPMNPRAHYATLRSPEQHNHHSGIRPSNSSPWLNYNNNDNSNNNPSATNGHRSYVDQLTVGKGIDYFL